MWHIPQLGLQAFIGPLRIPDSVHRGVGWKVVVTAFDAMPGITTQEARV